MAVGILLPFTPFGASVGLRALPGRYFGWLVLLVLCYAVLAQIVKTIYIRINHSWL
jgi:Mg2+-importing ATPase